MRHLRFLPILLATLPPLAAGAAGAQARPVLGPRSLESALVRELDSALAPLQEGNLAAARRQLDRLLDGRSTADLGPIGYARALQLGLAGEPERAVAALDLHFAGHPGPPRPSHAVWVGQIYLDALREQVSQGEIDGGQVRQLALRALALQQPPTTVAAVVGAALAAPLSSSHADAIRLAIATCINADSTLAPPERQRALIALRGGQVATNPTAAATPLALVLHTVSGRRIDLASLRGRVVLLHFWAAWCPVSEAEAPTLSRAFERFHTRGLEVIGIAAEDDGEAVPVLTTAARLGLAWEHVLDGDGLTGPLAGRFGIETLPHAILIDRQGVLRLSGEALRGDSLAPAIEKLLEEPAPARESPR